jgi:fatty acid desaturase
MTYLLGLEKRRDIDMKKLIWFTVLMTLSMILLILGRLLSGKGFDWLTIIPTLILGAIIIHFFVEYKKLNNLK